MCETAWYWAIKLPFVMVAFSCDAVICSNSPYPIHSDLGRGVEPVGGFFQCFFGGKRVREGERMFVQVAISGCVCH